MVIYGSEEVNSPACLVSLHGDADWPLWRAARLAALADAPEAFPGAATEWAEGGEQRWQERLLDPSALKLVAVIEAAPVGLVRGVLEDGTAWLHSLWVSPQLRGRGVADELIAGVEEWAQPRAASINLAVVPGNVAAIALYRRHGYFVSETPEELLGDGGHELVMVKRFG